MPARQGLDFSSGAIATANPHDTRSAGLDLTTLLKIRIPGHDGQPMFERKMPDSIIIGALQSGLTHMHCIGKHISQPLGQRRRKVLVEQELHAASVN